MEIAEADKLALDRQAGSLERLAISRHAVMHGRDVERSGDVADPPVAEIDQMGDGVEHRALVVENEGVGIDAFANAVEQRRRSAGRNNEKIDLVYGHNDPMAYGAYLAAKDVGREKDIKFIGIDGLPNEGVQLVANGELTATFTYVTPGAEGLRQAIKFLNGEKVEKTITLPTQKITKENAAQILKEHGL